MKTMSSLCYFRTCNVIYNKEFVFFRASIKKLLFQTVRLSLILSILDTEKRKKMVADANLLLPGT